MGCVTHMLVKQKTTIGVSVSSTMPKADEENLSTEGH